MQNNVTEIRTDALKLLVMMKRPIPRVAATIGAWLNIFQVIWSLRRHFKIIFLWKTNMPVCHYSFAIIRKVTWQTLKNVHMSYTDMHFRRKPGS